MSSSIKVNLELIDGRPRHVYYSHKMEPAFRTYQTPWGNYQSGASAGSFEAYSVGVVEPLCEASFPGSNLLLKHRGAHSSGSDNFGYAFRHILDIQMFKVEPDMLEVATYPNSAELQEGVFPSDYGIPDCRWQISVPLYGNGLVTVSLCPESAFTETRAS